MGWLGRRTSPLPTDVGWSLAGYVHIGATSTGIGAGIGATRPGIGATRLSEVVKLAITRGSLGLVVSHFSLMVESILVNS